MSPPGATRWNRTSTLVLAEVAGEMTYLVVALVVIIVGLVIENALRGPVKATRGGGHADGGDGGDGGGA
ncbi:hypothetical protein [Nocardioides sp. P5_E3]